MLKREKEKKKLKQKSFAAAVNREDIVNGAEDLGVELNEEAVAKYARPDRPVF